MKADRVKLKMYLAVFVFLLLIGILGFVATENLSLVDALYFSIVTMATVGYGDIHPQSGFGKILSIVLIFGGVGTFLGVVASITDIFVNRREEEARQQKVNMVAGLFFSEMGNGLLVRFSRLDPENEKLHRVLKVTNDWSDQHFHAAHGDLKRHGPSIDSRRGNLVELREELQGRVDLLLRLIENPSLMEHGGFTELLRAIFHLREELNHREDLHELLDSDRKHLENDILRTYVLLLDEWLRYMAYLQKNHGYLLSLATRVNPFDPEASPVVKDT